jgi:hypothetical protein
VVSSLRVGHSRAELDLVSNRLSFQGLLGDDTIGNDRSMSILAGCAPDGRSFGPVLRPGLVKLNSDGAEVAKLSQEVLVGGTIICNGLAGSGPLASGVCNAYRFSVRRIGRGS